jgi:predicted enzyme related to lactoylglutathione lyase
MPSYRRRMLTSIRILTTDVDRLVAFYETLLQATASRPAPVFAEFRGEGPAAVLAIADASTVPHATPGQNRSVVLEFRADPDAAAGRVDPDCVVQEPTTMPWGNRSLLCHDPDGNLVNVFTPVTAEARARFS